MNLQISTLFSLQDDSGQTFIAKDHLPLIIYFYPKDDTPGCTVEALDFSNLASSFSRLGYTVVGISRDSIDSHQKFKRKHNLNLILLSDIDGGVCKEYRVIKPKKIYGKEVMGIERSTFVLNSVGDIIHEYRKVRAAGHAETVLQDLLKDL
ncbi:MAG: peroxiredoxin [Neisseriaceae bacterium]